MRVSGKPHAQGALPRGRATPVLIIQEAVLGVFREETLFCLCRDAIPPHRQVRSL